MIECFRFYSYLAYYEIECLFRVDFYSQGVNQELSEVLNQLWSLDSNRLKPGTDYTISPQVWTAWGSVRQSAQACPQPCKAFSYRNELNSNSNSEPAASMSKECQCDDTSNQNTTENKYDKEYEYGII